MDPDEDLEISRRTWSKISSTVHKDGYREGASEGHDKYFQKGFDLGYMTGFQNAHQMGKINGALRALKELDIEKKEVLLETYKGLEFENCHRGLCVMCPTSSEADEADMSKQSIAASADQFETTSIQQILDKQSENFKHNYNGKVKKFNSLLNEIDLKL